MVIRKLQGMCREEFYRIFCFRNIFLSILFTEIILLIATGNYLTVYTDMEFDLYYAYEQIFNGGFMAELIIVPATVFVTSAFYVDFKNKWSYFLVARGNFKSYLWAKLFYGVFYVGTILFLSLAFYVSFLYGYTFIIKGEVGVAPEIDLYADVFEYNMFAYFLMRNFMTAVSGMLTVIWGFLITSVIMNRYISYISSYLAFIVWDNILLVSPFDFGIDRSMLMAGMVRYSDGWVIMIPVLFLIVAFEVLLIGNIVCAIMKRRYFDGNNSQGMGCNKK